MVLFTSVEYLMLETISLIVSVASGIVSSIGVVNTLSMDRHQRNNKAQLLLSIAETLDEVVETFKRDEIPHGACEAMREYAEFLPSILSGILDDTLVQEYADKLYKAHNVEMLYATVQQDKNNLIELEKAAGYFRAATRILEVR